MLEMSGELFGAKTIAECTGGGLSGSGTAIGVSTDTRTLRSGEVFVALSGDRFDGHDYVRDAIEAGASGVVVARPTPPGVDVSQVFVVLVDSTRQALIDLAAYYRKQLRASVAAITGSCGKTTTKEMAAHMLSPFVSLISATRSFNNEIGVPLTLFRARHTTEVCLLEIGTNEPGEVARLARAAAPDIAVVTMIGPAHLAGLGSLEGVFDEKVAILDAIPDRGVAVLPADDPFFPRMRERAFAKGPRTVLSFGFSDAADLRAVDVVPTALGTSFTLHVGGPLPACAPLRVELPRLGAHNVSNCLAALAVAAALRNEHQAGLADLAAGLLALPPTPGRLDPRPGISGSVILDDSYNANPASLAAALDVLDTYETARKKVLVLGDMLELGPSAESMHVAAGRRAAATVDLLVTVGPLAACAAEAFLDAGGARTACFLGVERLLARLPALVGDGDHVLVKGSNGVHLNRVVELMTARPASSAQRRDKPRPAEEACR